MTTKIEWSDETWNPVVGCEWASPGCDGCYAAREAFGRLRHLPLYAGLAIRTPGEQPRFTGEVRTVPSRLDQPVRWKRPRRIFVNSMSDLFHPKVPTGFIAEVFASMALAPQHQFQILTKRPGRARSLLDSPLFAISVRDQARRSQDALDWSWPLPNVWLGTSIESDHFAFRASVLADTNAAVRFLSIEPLIGPVDPVDVLLDGIGWVIVGGESGPAARPMPPVHVRAIRDACVERGVPFLFKQWGEWAPADSVMDRAASGVEGRLLWGTWMDRVGKKAAGRLLDGRTWDEYPVPLVGAA